MAQIDISNLTFCYEGSADDVFDNVSFSIDTNWRLGFIGRNGKGKTTFLNLLLGKYEYRGNIGTNMRFDYFPYKISEAQQAMCASEFLDVLKAGCEEWRVMAELSKLDTDAELLYRPFSSLSHGERTKVLLAVLFSGENEFLLIDEPTNHLDQDGRETVKKYLREKKGFILVSHDRDLLDACVDHVLVLNRKTIEVQSGNFSSWWENKQRADSFSRAENEKHIREIASLKRTAERSSRWAQKNENTKIGFDPVKEHDRFISSRSYIGAKTKKMESRVKQYERRMEQAIKEKEGLLQDIENPASLKIMPLSYHKEVLIYADKLALSYKGCKEPVLSGLKLEIRRGERIFLHGKNGCGKSTLLKALLKSAGMENEVEVTSGELHVAAGLSISYVNQDTSFLCGSLKKFCRDRALEERLFFSMLRKLGLERIQFEKPLEDFSEGQKKKVLLAASIMVPAHLYIWDEPLNYIDVFSRIQLEELLLGYQPTMLLVDHDIRFQERLSTRIIEM